MLVLIAMPVTFWEIGFWVVLELSQELEEDDFSYLYSIGSE
jgi:hypothetical protein